MKKRTFIPALMSLLLAGTACNDVLDIQPSNMFDAETVFSSEGSVDHYLYSLYSYLRTNSEISNYSGTGFTDAYSDILKSGSWDQYNHPYNRTVQLEAAFNDTSAGTFECWTGCYTHIRQCNEFMEALPRYRQRFGEDFVKERTAEARFLRDFAYWQLLRVYGRCVLRTQVEGPDQNDKPLSGPAGCWTFVMQDLRASAADIADRPVETGRVGKAAVWGFLSRVALYAESWQDVIDAADSCALYGASLMPNYATVFDESQSHCAENLITVDFTKDGTVIHRADNFFRPSGDGRHHNNATVYGTFGPTSELVDSYEMADGTPFDWNTCGDQPYEGREPRFYASILYHGAPWEGRVVSVDAQGEDARQDYECSGGTTSTPTGYYLRKFITENDTNWETKQSSHFGITLRYAEVLLNKAEALARQNRIPEGTAVLNTVRDRVRLPGRTCTSADELMADLRHERMVELAGEGLRFWDLRRWHLADQLLNGVEMHGVNVTRQADGRCTYEQISVDAGRPRFFFERYYAFAIPLTERTNNKAIDLYDNNPGW